MSDLVLSMLGLMLMIGPALVSLIWTDPTAREERRRARDRRIATLERELGLDTGEQWAEPSQEASR